MTLQAIDVVALKRDHPVADVVLRYGIELRQQGRTQVGRCPFHADRGRPNLHLYPDTESWYCFRCGVGGDVISLVERLEGLGFIAAVARLTASGDGQSPPRRARPRVVPSYSARNQLLSPEAQACLVAALDLYTNRLIADPQALDYLHGRGVDDATLALYRLGYASGEDLASYLLWRRLPLGAAFEAGLLRSDGGDFLAGRIVVPELRNGQPIWLIGRSLAPIGKIPKYLGLPGRKPLLGWEDAAHERTVFLVEGPFDWLVLRTWGLPTLALVGIHAHPSVLQALARFERVFVALDSDDAGDAAAAALAETLGSRATRLRLPGVKDVGELGPLSDGRERFLRAIGLHSAPNAA